jgi:3-hydroxyisobutyrate dehydrogenase-like beta-hydroxyacid dehydrogenase
MGLPMATNLATKGFTVLAYDTDPTKGQSVNGIKLMPIK